MDRYIIKGAGKMHEITTALATLQAVYGKDAKLCDIENAKRFYEVKKVVENQFEKGDNL